MTLKSYNGEMDLSFSNFLPFQFYLRPLPELLRQLRIEHKTRRLIDANQLIMQPILHPLARRRPQLVLDALLYGPDKFRRHLALQMHHLLVTWLAREQLRRHFTRVGDNRQPWMVVGELLRVEQVRGLVLQVAVHGCHALEGLERLGLDVLRPAYFQADEARLTMCTG